MRQFETMSSYAEFIIFVVWSYIVHRYILYYLKMQRAELPDHCILMLTLTFVQKRRSGRHAKRKKYMDEVDLNLSDDNNTDDVDVDDTAVVPTKHAAALAVAANSLTQASQFFVVSIVQRQGHSGQGY